MDQLKASQKAGKINREAIEYGFSYAVPGTLATDLDYALGEFIRSFDGCEPAFLGYQGFPVNACINVNAEVVHGIAKRGYRIKEGDVLTIDIGTKLAGWCTDAAETRIVGESANTEHERLIEGSNAILEAALSEVKHGNTLHSSALASEAKAEEFQLNIYPNLGGHQIGKSVHEGFQFLHTPRGLDFPTLQMQRCITLQSGMFICVEPIVTLGATVFETHRDGWTLISQDGCFSAQQEKMVLVTEDSYEVLS